METRYAQRTLPRVQEDPNLNAEDQLAPSQLNQPMPAAVAEPTAPRAPAPRGFRNAQAGGKPAATPAAPPAPPRHESHPAKPPRGLAMHTIACSGVFAKDSSNLNLATTFDARNVAFTEVDGGTAGKVMASVLFPKDPRRRLEVWWSDPAQRSGIYLIVIGGESMWIAPGGMRLGLTIEQLEKLNHKSFKLKGYESNRTLTVSDWNGGALATLAGGCKSGLTLTADKKIPDKALAALPADKEYSSDDAAVRATRPHTSEVLIGY
jgi:hypothetical protein